MTLSDSSGDDIQFSECENEEFICCVKNPMNDIFEVAAKPNTEQVLREQLKNDVARMSIRLSTLEQALKQRLRDVSAVMSTSASSIVTGKCWNCGQPGHSYRRYPTRKPDDKSALPFVQPRTHDRISQMALIANPTSENHPTPSLNQFQQFSDGGRPFAVKQHGRRSKLRQPLQTELSKLRHQSFPTISLISSRSTEFGRRSSNDATTTVYYGHY